MRWKIWKIVVEVGMPQSLGKQASESELLSVVMDGEAAPFEIQDVCKGWRDDAHVRSEWHVYHLIGDALRSDELVTAPSKDRAFLEALRVRLAEEPVVLSPEAVSAPVAPARSRSRRWVNTAAVAAGFVAVAGVVAVLRPVEAPGGAGPVLVQAPSQAVPVLVGSGASAVSTEPLTVVVNGRLIRDARLDEYLAVHKKFGGSSAPGVPSGFLRNAAVDVSGR